MKDIEDRLGQKLNKCIQLSSKLIESLQAKFPAVLKQYSG